MRRKSILAGAAAAALIALAAGWYFGSPRGTLWRGRGGGGGGGRGAAPPPRPLANRETGAPGGGPVRTLASYVDLETMNRGAAAAARAYWRKALEEIPRTVPAARRFAASINRRFAAVDSESQIRLDELRPWLSEIPTAVEKGDRARGYPYIVHRGLDTFEMRYRGAGRDTGPLLTFRRHGLGWKLAGVRWGQQLCRSTGGNGSARKGTSWPAGSSWNPGAALPGQSS